MADDGGEHRTRVKFIRSILKILSSAPAPCGRCGYQRGRWDLDSRCKMCGLTNGAGFVADHVSAAAPSETPAAGESMPSAPRPMREAA